MKITKQYLKQVIKEEIEKALEEAAGGFEFDVLIDTGRKYGDGAAVENIGKAKIDGSNIQISSGGDPVDSLEKTFENLKKVASMGLKAVRGHQADISGEPGQEVGDDDSEKAAFKTAGAVLRLIDHIEEAHPEAAGDESLADIKSQLNKIGRTYYRPSYFHLSK